MDIFEHHHLLAPIYGFHVHDHKVDKHRADDRGDLATLLLAGLMCSVLWDTEDAQRSDAPQGDGTLSHSEKLSTQTCLP